MATKKKNTDKQYAENLTRWEKELKAGEEDRKYWRAWGVKVLTLFADIEYNTRKK